jgi:tetratricopeptide (TPR) repeat protein
MLAVLTATSLCVGAPADEPSDAPGAADAGSPAAAESWIDAGRGLASEMAWTISDIYFHRADLVGTFYPLLGAIEADPHDPDAYICAGVILFSMDMEEDSLKMRMIGLDHTRDLFDVWHDLGFWYYDRLDYAKARDYFEQAAKRPCPPFVYKMWAHACEHNGELKKALDIWEMVRAMTPDDPVIDLNVSRIKELLAGSGG